MRDTPHRWLSWRVAAVGHSAARPGGSPVNRLRGAQLAPPISTVADPNPLSDALADLKADIPGPDGIRRRLVEHVRRLIAEGVYDTPERWAAAEERLFQRVADGR